MGYMLAVAVSLLYSLWYILSGALVSLSPNTSPIFTWMLIEATSATLMFIIAKGDLKIEKLSDLKYPISSAAAYALGNYIFYILIAMNGVPAASAFGTAEIIIFTLLIWVTTKRDVNMAMYSFASAIIAAGLVIESLVIRNGIYSLNGSLIALGLLIAVFYGAATYFYYLSTKRIKSKFTTMFFIQAPQVLIFGASVLLFVPASNMPAITGWYALLTVIVGAVLLASFYFETLMMKVLANVGRGAVATGYILSDMQLIPVVVYYLIVNPGAWQTYVPGLLLVTIGLAMLDWK